MGGRSSRRRTCNPRGKSPVLCLLSYRPWMDGAPGRTRTSGRPVRTREFCSAELRGRVMRDGGAPLRVVARARGDGGSVFDADHPARGHQSTPIHTQSPCSAMRRIEQGNGVPARIQTRGLRRRMPVLCSAELRGRVHARHPDGSGRAGRCWCRRQDSNLHSPQAAALSRQGVCRSTTSARVTGAGSGVRTPVARSRAPRPDR